VRFVFAEILPLTHGDLPGFRRQVTGVDMSDREPLQFLVEERVGSAHFHAILHLQICSAAQSLQGIVHDTFAALLGGFRGGHPGGKEQGDRDQARMSHIGLRDKSEAFRPELSLYSVTDTSANRLPLWLMVILNGSLIPFTSRKSS